MMRLMGAFVLVLAFGLISSACGSNPVAESERKIANIVKSCEAVKSGPSLIPCEVGVRMSKSDLTDEMFRICREVSSHSLVRRDGFQYDGIGRVEGDPAVAWLYAHDLVSARLPEISAVKLELIKKEMSGFGISEWSNKCSRVYFASLELLSRREGL